MQVRALNRHGASDLLLEEIREKYLPTPGRQQAVATRGAAALKVQKSWRGFGARLEVEEIKRHQACAATAVQTLYRGNRARSVVEVMNTVPVAQV